MHKIAHLKTLDTGIAFAGNVIYVGLDIDDTIVLSADNETTLCLTNAAYSFFVLHRHSHASVSSNIVMILGIDFDTHILLLNLAHATAAAVSTSSIKGYTLNFVSGIIYLCHKSNFSQYSTKSGACCCSLKPNFSREY